MARFLSKKYPSLKIKFSDGSRVKFDHGKAEVDGDLAKRLAEHAKAFPDMRIEQVEGDERPATPKQKAQAKARDLGLDDSGTQAEIEARIAAHEAGDDPEDDPEDGDESDDTEEPNEDSDDE